MQQPEIRNLTLLDLPFEIICKNLNLKGLQELIKANSATHLRIEGGKRIKDLRTKDNKSFLDSIFPDSEEEEAAYNNLSTR